MKKSQNLRQVGYSMILVSASLVAILVIGVAIGEMFYLQTICLETAQLISMSVKKMISKQMDVRYTGIELTIKFQEYT